MYRCISCGKEIKMKNLNKVQCPYCGYRIIEKTRLKKVKKIRVR